MQTGDPKAYLEGEVAMTNPRGALRLRNHVLAVLFATVFAATGFAEEAKSDAGGGVPLYRESVVCTADVVLPATYNRLIRSYYGSEKEHWQSFQDTAASIIKICNPALLTTNDPWFFFLLPEFREVPGVLQSVYYRRALVHGAPSPTFQSTRIIYDKDIALYDVHITAFTSEREAIAPVDTDCTATPVEDPVIGGIKKALALVVASWQPQGVFLFEVPRPLKPSVYKVSVTKLVLPFGLHRATITLKDSAKDASMPGSSSYYLAPLTYLEIGLGAAYVTRTALNQAATVDNSTKLVDATPTTLLTYVAANWRPWGYDESDRRPSFRQDFRVVIGPALTPNPGFVLGVGFAPAPSLRPLSIQAGFGLLLANVVRSGDTLGKPPQNPAHPTKRGGLGVWFIGLGYGL
jgi:hypothetical protein